ncbi:MAG: hypothetical protein PHW13_04655 [Methylococcales bacterium]|nr:hypothetical protein [Methylococcales bacterium]
MFSLIDSLKYKANKIAFSRACRKIRLTKPIKYTHRDDIRILSQVHHQAIDMYLLAIKSFLYNFTVGSVYVLNDGSLTDSDIELLEQHVPDITIRHIKDIDVSGFPVGNTWERLLYNVDLSQDAYVIQLDSDTLTMKPMPDLHQAVKDQRGFIIGNGPAWERPVDVNYMFNIVSNWASHSANHHVQTASEMVFHSIATFEGSKDYFRGCSAFTGLPKGQINRQMLKGFSQQVVAEIGEKKWNEWGSEQVACSVMISKTSDPSILPWLSYQNFGFPSLYMSHLVTATLIHFIGTHRFSNRTYQQLAMRFIREYGGGKL